MSNNTNIYSPLPQSISDSESDSERELQMDPICSNLSNIQSNRNYNYAHKQNGFKSLPKVKKIQPKMSLLRKIAFIVSILLCFIPIIVFLWILPCCSDSCTVKTANWENQQNEVEIMGKVNLVHGTSRKNFNIALMYKGNINSSEISNHGVIVFRGTDGNVLWYLRQDSVPTQLDCTLLDANGNGQEDCILLDEKGLKVIDSVAGQIIWHAHSHEGKTAINNLDFPVKFPDVNSDGINELLSVYQQKYLLVICGKSGQVLTKIMVDQCNEVHDLQVVNNIIQFNCRSNNNTDLLYFQSSLVNLQDKFKNSSISLNFYKIDKKTDSPACIIGDRKLTVNNFGKCPNCFANISLTDKMDNKLRVWTYTSSYVSKPTPFTFDSSEANINLLQGHVNGFILKVQNWPEEYHKSQDTTSSQSPNQMYIANFITETVLLITFNSTSYQAINASQTNVSQLCFASERGFDHCQPDIFNQEQSLLVADLDHDGSQELISYFSTFYSVRDLGQAKSWKLSSTMKVMRLEAELPQLYETVK